MKYLRPRQYYEDRYDLETIEDCLLKIKIATSIKFNNEEKSLEAANEIKKAFAELFIYYYKGDRYIGRQKSIEQSIAEDTKLQNLFDDASLPFGLTCKNCCSEVNYVRKILIDWVDNPFVIFVTDCPNCKVRCSYTSDGSEYDHRSYCEVCKSVLAVNSEREGDVIKTTYTCKECNSTKEELLDLKKSSEEYRNKEMANSELLQKYRKAYCLNEKDGKDYQINIVRSESLNQSIREKKEKDNDPIYIRATKIEKINASAMQKVVKKIVIKNKYENLSFGNPLIDKFVIVPFTVSDPTTRDEYKSKKILESKIKKALANTNWRLMSSGTSYRLGILSGDIKGYDREADLYKLAQTLYKKELKTR